MASMRGSPVLSPMGAWGPASPRRSSGRRRGLIAAVVLLASGVIASSVACGTEPVGVEACRRIERVRCESAQACGIDLGRPLHSGDSPESNVAACIRYYDDQCLHGLVVTKEPSPQSVDACVDAIVTGDCSVVKAPETDEACKFLVPPVAPPSAAADASDATSDAPGDSVEAGADAG